MILLFILVAVSNSESPRISDSDLDYAIVSDTRVDIITYYYPHVFCSICNVTGDDERIVYIEDPNWEAVNMTVELWNADGSLRETKILEVVRKGNADGIRFHIHYASLALLAIFGIVFVVAMVRHGGDSSVATMAPGEYQSEKQKDIELGKKLGIYDQ
jgi:hypothetical protein